MKPLSVNDAILNLDTYAKQNIYLVGALMYDFENISINHFPKSERTNDFYKHSIWLSCSPLLKFDERSMQKMANTRVLVEGKLIPPDPKFGGCGHLSLWPAEIVATDITPYKYNT